MLTLDQIAIECGTDKCIEGGHAYVKHYDHFFAPLRFTPVTLCEIGTWRGASMRMWRRYFDDFEAKIVGFDHAPEWLPDKDNPFCRDIVIEVGSQEDMEFQRDFGKRHGPFDIVVDDGGHKPQQHVASFTALWRFVKPGGYYCIEDLHSIWDPCWHEYRGEQTIFDLLDIQWQDVLVGGSDIQEVHVLGGHWNDGLLVLRKRYEDYHPRT